MRAAHRSLLAILLILLTMGALTCGLDAQTPDQSGGQQPAPSAGGPQGGTGPIIIPKKKSPETAPTPPPPPPPAVATKPEYSFKVNVPEVQIPVTVETKDGDFIGHLQKGNFRIWEDGVPQAVDTVRTTNDAPMTVVILVEFRNTWWPFLYQILEAGYSFTGTLQPKDWVALVTYDMRPHIVVDFTHDKRAIFAGLQTLQFPGFSEANLFDALADTIDRLQGVKGHKMIVLITTGLDTFSRLTFGQIRKKVENTEDISIYSVSIGWALREWMQANGMMGSIAELDFLQADNELRYFSKVTGGRFYQPRFEGAFNDVFQDIAATVRNQYILAYHPTNRNMDGSYRKVKVDIVGPNGEPLKVVNQKGKNVKYVVQYKPGYESRHVVE